MRDLQIRSLQRRGFRASGADDVDAARDALAGNAGAGHDCDDDALATGDEPPAWVAFGLGVLVVAGMTGAAYLIAAVFEVLLGLAG